jgi:hypothetical protein
MYERQLLQMTHALGRLRAHQVALARMSAQNLSILRELETLRGSAVRLQFQFWFRSVPWHLLSPNLAL